MNKRKSLVEEYWNPFGESYHCSESKHKDGNCFACRIMNLCFKKNKILFLKSKGYYLKYLAILKPVIFSHKEKRKSEQILSSLLKRNFEYKNLEDFKKQSIEISNSLCKINNGLKAISIRHELGFATKDLYYYFLKMIDGKEYLMTLHFLFVNSQFDNSFSYAEDLEELMIEEENIEITKINKKRIRLGLDSNTRRKIYRRDNYTCYYCGWRNGLPNQEDKPLSIDHIVPKGLGGTSKDKNLVTCCFDCNVKKNDKFLPTVIKDWMWEYDSCSKVKHNSKNGEEISKELNQGEIKIDSLS
jgi:hypothetical protein